MAARKKLDGWQTIRSDGWTNIFTNLNVEGKDKRTGLRIYPRFLQELEADNIYNADDIAAKIIDRPPEEMTREGFEVTTSDGNNFNSEIQKWFKAMDLNKKICKCLKDARLYGGSALLFGIDDGRLPNKPVDMNNIKAINYITPLTRYDFQSISSLDIDRDVPSPNFKNPLFYKLTSDLQDKQSYTSGWDGKIHYSRLIRFEGVPVNGINRAMVNYWGDSILSRLWNPISNYQVGHDSAAIIIQDVVKLIVKLKDLHRMIAQGDDTLITKRLQLLSKTASVINAIVIEEGEEAESKTTNLAGIPDMLDRLDRRLVAATDMPHTILLGESPSGLGATGESEKSDWYDHIKNKQKADLTPPLEKILTFYFMSKKSPTNGKLPETLTITYKPLSQPNEKQKADLRKTVAETDEIYYGMGVYDEDEIAESRWGSGQYSMETVIDFEARGAVDEAKAEEPEPETTEDKPKKEEA